jgi:filamentous hemagglutinin family protein
MVVQSERVGRWAITVTTPLTTGLVGCWLAATLPVSAQLVPDNTLGAESSLITPNVLFDNALIERIDGGAARGSTLFHSFSEFTVNTDQRVYFANPMGVDLIFSRVTGVNGSDIFGTLGVLGGADLVLINPNGIVFGSDAQLDVRGSFTASTASGVEFENGYRFDATDPTAPPLLTLALRPGLESWLSPTDGDITSTARLTTGQDLTLLGQRLDVQGQLQAGGDLTLVATDTLRVEDVAVAPTQLQAGANLRLQGNQGIDIALLNHSDSGIWAGGDLSLRSNRTVQGDARYAVGGDFRIEQLDGTLGNLSSPLDPIIQANGDVSFASYSGASLHILAGGSVSIGTIEITDAAAPGEALIETVSLSDGQTLAIDGTANPTLDIRAGVNFAVLPGNTITPPGALSPDFTDASGANITIDSIVLFDATAGDGGLVFLSNQYQPNANLSGDITVGSLIASDPGGGSDVVLDSRGGIVANFIDVSGVDASFAFTGNSGDVTLLANGPIVLPLGSTIFADGLAGGNITLISQTSIVQEAPITDFADGFISSLTSEGAAGGTIRLSAPSITIRGNIFADRSAATPGRGSDIRIEAGRLEVDTTSIETTTADTGDAGDIVIVAEDVVVNDSLIGSSTFAANQGNSGTVSVTTNTLSATNGGQIGTFSDGFGNAGLLIVDASDSIVLDGFVAISGSGVLSSALLSTVGVNGVGSGDTIRVSTNNLTLTNGAQIRTSTEGAGDAGDIVIDMAGTLAIDGVIFSEEVSDRVFPSSIVSEVLPGSSGVGGEITITTGRLVVTNGGSINAGTAEGDAGSIAITALRSAILEGQVSFANVGLGEFASNIRVDTSPGSQGQGGQLLLNTPILTLNNGGRIFVDSQGDGVGGDVVVNAEQVRLDRGSISAEADSADGGNITLTLGPGLVLRNGSRISATAGRALGFGNGGNVTIDMPEGFVVAVLGENSDITANAFLGDGGNVTIAAQGLFGIEPQLELTENSDITASSEFGLQGAVSIESPDIDPSDDLVELPTTLVDASRLVAQGCGAGATNVANALGEFTVTGRGGLPATPEQVVPQSSLVTWEDLGVDTVERGAATAPVQAAVPSSEPGQLVEFQGWVLGDKGEIILTANPTMIVPHTPWAPSATCQAM